MSTVERVVSVLLLVVFAAAALLAAFFGLFLGMFSDGCGSGVECDFDQIGSGVVIASLGQVPLAVVVACVTVARLLRSRPAWWVPLLGLVGVAALLVVGATVSAGGVPA